MPRSPLSIRQVLDGMRAWTRSCPQRTLSVELMVPGLLFSSSKTGDEGSRDYFFWSDEGWEGRVLGFSVDVSLPSIRKS